jgi:hypothetical protein
MPQQKNAGQKNEERGAFIAIFLPAIFLLSMVCRVGDPGLRMCPDISV